MNKTNTTTKTRKKKIQELKNEIKYEKKRMEHCAYGKSDLMYLYQLEHKLHDLENQTQQ